MQVYSKFSIYICTWERIEWFKKQKILQARNIDITAFVTSYPCVDECSIPVIRLDEIHRDSVMIVSVAGRTRRQVLENLEGFVNSVVVTDSYLCSVDSVINKTMCRVSPLSMISNNVEIFADDTSSVFIDDFVSIGGGGESFGI